MATPPTITRVTTGDLVFALDVANVARRAGEGRPKLGSLPFGASTPKDPSACLLALAFNHSCFLYYDAGEHDEESFWVDSYPYEHDGYMRYGGYVQFEPDKGAVASAIAGALGAVEPFETEDGWWIVPLPDRVTRIASAYDSDAGRRELFLLAVELGWLGPDADPDENKSLGIDPNS